MDESWARCLFARVGWRSPSDTVSSGYLYARRAPMGHASNVRPRYSRSRRTSSRRLSWSSRQAGQPSRWARIPGTRVSASSPASSSSTYSSRRSKHSSQLTSGPSGPSSSSIIVHLPQLAPGVVQGLVERAAGRAESLRQHVDRDAVERQRHEHLALARGQLGANRALQGMEELALLEPLVGRQAGVGDLRPALLVDLDLASAPRAAASLHARLEQRELVGPGREAAGAAEVVELGEHGHQRVVGRLHGEVVVVDPPAAELEPGRAQQQSVELADRGVAIRAAEGGEEGVVGDGHDGEHDGWRLAASSSYVRG